jgi:ribosomal protein S18 acetylase RimI-like enzyme
MTTEERTYIPLMMVREHMDHIPSFACPAGFRIRTFVRGDQPSWARIEALAGEFADQDEALHDFEEEFGADLDRMEECCFILETDDGEPIGTATAWSGDFQGVERGRVHWVGIVPAYQGRKLAKPLLSAVMARLARDHESAYLTTGTKSYRAINMYLDFGFVPALVEDDEAHWHAMEQLLRRTIPLGRR